MLSALSKCFQANIGNNVKQEYTAFSFCTPIKAAVIHQHHEKNSLSDCSSITRLLSQSVMRLLLAEIERDYKKERERERMILLDCGAQEQDIVLYHKERILKSVKDPIDPFHEQQHPTPHHSLSLSLSAASTLSLHSEPL